MAIWRDDTQYDLELIDTCWDVNLDKCDCTQATAWELIDTCWDVNVVG